MERNESFVFYVSFYEAAQDLPDGERLALYEAICRYALYGEESGLQGALKLMFILIKPQLDANKDRKKNGKKGGRPPNKTDGSPEEKPPVTECENHRLSNEKPPVSKSNNHRLSNEKPNENVNANENGNENNLSPSPLKAREVLSQLTIPANIIAKEAQEKAAELLESHGYDCHFEYPVEDRGDGRSGRIDIMAYRGGEVVAIEFDWQTPREKSVYKLNQMADAEKIILLRGGNPISIPGIHVISVKIEQSSESVAAEQAAGAGEAKPVYPSATLTERQFQAFYESYPRKQGKIQAFSEWRHIAPDEALYREIMDGLEQAKKSKGWQDDNGHWIPRPKKFLEDERWKEFAAKGSKRDKYRQNQTDFSWDDVYEVK